MAPSPRTPLRNMEVYVEIPHSPLWSSNAKKTAPKAASKPGSIPSSKSQTQISQFFTESLHKRALSNAAGVTKSDPRSTLKRALSDKPVNVEVYVDLVSPKKRKADDAENVGTEKVVKKAKTGKQSGVDENGQVIKKHKAKPAVKDDVKQAQTDKPIVRRAKKSIEATWVAIEGFEDRDEVEERIQLREFLLRFEPILKLAKIHVEALDEFSSFAEVTAKAIVKSLLDLIAVDSTGAEKASITKSLKAISAAGTDTNKIWDHLQALLRDTLHVHIPTPPSSPIVHKTRTGPTRVLRPQSLIGCLLALTDVALNGASVRAELLEGEKDLKEKTKDWAKAVKEEGEKWSEIRMRLLLEKPPKAGKESPKEDQEKEKAYKAKYAKANKEHKALKQALDAEYFQSSYGIASRFQPLGRDAEGRVYYVLSPWSGSRIPAKTTREGLTKWAWFVAVWGKRPGHDADGDDEPNWWGFSDVEEIRKLSKLVETAANAEKAKGMAVDRDGDGMPAVTSAETAALCKGLTSFADYLEWRVGDEEEVKETAGKVSKKDVGKEIPAKRFYGH